MLPKLSIVDFSYLDKTKLLEILALRNSDYVREKMASSEEILEVFGGLESFKALMIKIASSNKPLAIADSN